MQPNGESHLHNVCEIITKHYFNIKPSVFILTRVIVTDNNINCAIL